MCAVPRPSPARLRYATPGDLSPLLRGEVKTAPPARRRRASAPAPANSRTPSGSPSSCAGRQHADHRHHQRADRGGRGRQALQRCEPARVADAELHEGHGRPSASQPGRRERARTADARSTSLRSATGTQPTPICQAASEIGGRCERQAFGQHRAERHANRAGECEGHAGPFAEWRQNRPRRTGWRGPKGRPREPTARSSEKCSFRINRASSDTHTGIDAATTAASVPRSHTSASPMNDGPRADGQERDADDARQQLARHLQILLQQHRKQRQPERADDAGQTARRERRPFA